MQQREQFDGPSDQTALVTISYRGDLHLAQDLCRSVDEFAGAGIQHILVVPKRDSSLFAPLQSSRRTILAVEDVLPAGYRRIPAPDSVSLPPFYRRRIREIWWGPSGFVRGWIVQQILKLSTPSFVDRDVIVMIDSDVVLVRKLDESTFRHDGLARLYRVPGATRTSAMHQAWHRSSAELVGLERLEYFGSDYIGNLVTWRRDVVLALQRRIEEVSGVRWDKAVCRKRDVSEYILYGVFVEHILGLDAARLAPTSDDLVHAGWHYDLTAEIGVQDFARSLSSRHVGVAIQSTEALTLSQRRRLVKEMVSHLEDETGNPQIGTTDL